LRLAAPATFRLDLTSPEALALTADGNVVTVRDAHGQSLPLPPEVAGVAAFARTLTDLLLGSRTPPGFSERWEKPDVVALVPQDDRTSPFAEIRLEFAPNGQLPESIVLRERGGDRTTIRLRNVVVNGDRS
jgi:hypothetical protein